MKASCYKFFMWLWYVQGWDVVNMSWVGGIKIPKKWIGDGVLVIFIDDVVT
jgi:hypothetical protein